MRARSSCLSNGSSTKSSAPASSAAILSWSGFAVTITIGTNLVARSEEHTSELQSQSNLVCRLLLEKKKSPLPVPSVLVVGPVEQCLPVQRDPAVSVNGILLLIRHPTVRLSHPSGHARPDR